MLWQGRVRFRHSARTDVNRLSAAALNSFRGLKAAARSDAAVREELIACALAVPAGSLLAPSLAWYVAMIAALLFVLAVEMLNTSIEKLADHVTPERHPHIGIIKDMGSAAVFFALAVAGLIWAAALVERI